MEVYLKLSLAHLTVSRRGRLSENRLSALGVGMQQTKFFSSQLSKWLMLADWSSLGTLAKHGWILSLRFSVTWCIETQGEFENKPNITSLMQKGVRLWLLSRCLFWAFWKGLKNGLLERPPWSILPPVSWFIKGRQLSVSIRAIQKPWIFALTMI